MLEISEQAANVLHSMVPGEGSACVRIHPVLNSQNGDGNSVGFRVDVAEAPEPDDEPVNSRGVEIWIDAAAVHYLDDKVLDTVPDPRGWSAFVLHAA